MNITINLERKKKRGLWLCASERCEIREMCAPQTQSQRFYVYR